MAIESAISSSLSYKKSNNYDIAWGVIFMFVVGGLHALFIFLVVQKVSIAYYNAVLVAGHNRDCGSVLGPTILEIRRRIGLVFFK